MKHLIRFPIRYIRDHHLYRIYCSSSSLVAACSPSSRSKNSGVAGFKTPVCMNLTSRSFYVLLNDCPQVKRWRVRWERRGMIEALHCQYTRWIPPWNARIPNCCTRPFSLSAQTLIHVLFLTDDLICLYMYGTSFPFQWPSEYHQEDVCTNYWATPSLVSFLRSRSDPGLSLRRRPLHKTLVYTIWVNVRLSIGISIGSHGLWWELPLLTSSHHWFFCFGRFKSTVQQRTLPWGPCNFTVLFCTHLHTHLSLTSFCSQHSYGSLTCL